MGALESRYRLGMKMRVAFNATFSGRRHNGTMAVSDGFLSCLANLGHELIVYSPLCHDGQIAGTHWRSTPLSVSADGGPMANFKRFAWSQAVLPLRLRNERADLFFSPSAE